MLVQIFFKDLLRVTIGKKVLYCRLPGTERIYAPITMQRMDCQDCNDSSHAHSMHSITINITRLRIYIYVLTCPVL